MPSTLQPPNGLWQHASIKRLIATFHTQLSEWPVTTPIVVGCSGGRDSLLLACVLSHICPKQLHVLCIDHQLQAQSAEWAEHVLAYCRKWQVICKVIPVCVAAGNVEQQARLARYKAFNAYIAAFPSHPKAVLVLGHHRQDQAETVLLNLFRGSGAQGLGGMRALDVRDQYLLWRPLLTTARDEISQWVNLLQLEYIQDPANDLLAFDRVYLRQAVWPLLESKFAGFEGAVARSSLLQHDAAEILASVAVQDLAALSVNVMNNLTIDIGLLSKLSFARQRNVIMCWLKGNANYAPAYHIVDAVLTQIAKAKSDADPVVYWENWQIRRHLQRLVKLPREIQCAVQETHHLALGKTITLPSGTWQVISVAQGLPMALLNSPIDFYPRQGGEKLHFAGRVGHWPLKKQLQSLKLANWQKQQVHVLKCLHNDIGMLCASGFFALEGMQKHTPGWHLVRKDDALPAAF